MQPPRVGTDTHDTEGGSTSPAIVIFVVIVSTTPITFVLHPAQPGARSPSLSSSVAALVGASFHRRGLKRVASMSQARLSECEHHLFSYTRGANGLACTHGGRAPVCLQAETPTDKPLWRGRDNDRGVNGAARASSHCPSFPFLPHFLRSPPHPAPLPIVHVLLVYGEGADDESQAKLGSETRT